MEQKRDRICDGGSTNQTIEFPTERYSSLAINEVREVEVHIGRGNAMIYGYPNEEEKIR